MNMDDQLKAAGADYSDIRNIVADLRRAVKSAESVLNEQALKPVHAALDALELKSKDLEEVERSLDAVGRQVLSPVKSSLNELSMGSRWGLWIGLIGLIVSVGAFTVSAADTRRLVKRVGEVSLNNVRYDGEFPGNLSKLAQAIEDGRGEELVIAVDHAAYGFWSAPRPVFESYFNAIIRQCQNGKRMVLYCLDDTEFDKELKQQFGSLDAAGWASLQGSSGFMRYVSEHPTDAESLKAMSSGSEFASWMKDKEHHFQDELLKSGVEVIPLPRRPMLPVSLWIYDLDEGAMLSFDGVEKPDREFAFTTSNGRLVKVLSDATKRLLDPR